MAKTSLKKQSTQRYLNISEVRANTLIMDDDSIRSVLMVSSINFALKNEDEQNAIIGSYVNFLNNITFPLQIVVHSRELNIDEYLNLLKEKEKAQANELLKAQTAEYIDYVKDLVSLGKIMNKRFYIIVPYDPVADQKRNFGSRLISVFNPVSAIRMRQNKFLQLRSELDRRIENVMSGLNSIGLNVVELDTQGLIELFYNIYNPVVAQNQELTDVQNLRVSENN